jgi:putative tryptophan/tyrosine transport system substrate-binding protein
MRRRQFIAGLGSAAALALRPLAARAQQPAVPVVVYFSGRSADLDGPFVLAFRQGLSEGGYVEGRNVLVEQHWLAGQYDRAPALMADLVRRRVAVIAALGAPSALAAKAATTTIPIIFEAGVDPVEMGLIASLSRPGSNITGVANLTVELGPKKLQLLRELIPTAAIIGLLVNPANPNIEVVSKDMQAAARALGVELDVLRASTEREIDGVFTSLVQSRAGGLITGPDPFFLSRREQLVALTARHALPAIFPYREFALAGGLMSYGSNLMDVFRLVGVYAGRILKGEKPADLPVQQITKIETVINLKTAKALGLTIQETLLATADEVIQ